MPRLVILVALVLMAGACSGADADAPASSSSAPTTAATTSTTTSTSTTTTTTRAPATTTSTTAPLPRSVLTGLADGGSDLQVLIAKYSNAPKGRPPVGLEAADLVMEVLVEGGVSRLLAVFQSHYPEVVGPLRSIREVDPKLVEPFDARVVHSGGQGGPIAALGRVAVNEGDGVLRDGYFRADGRSFVYSLMFETTALPERDWDGEVAEVVTFSEEAPAGEPATTVDVDMSGIHVVRWEYTDGRYRRFQNAVSASTSILEPHVHDGGDPVEADTVVVLFVRQFSTGRRDASGSIVPDYDVDGTGDAIVFRDGVAVEGTWERADHGDFFTIYDGAGNVVAMKPGRTWFHLAPTGRSVTWSVD